MRQETKLNSVLKSLKWSMTIIPLDPVAEGPINPKIRGIMVKINEAIKQPSFLKNAT
jgi:hypothetical protein